MRQVRIRSSRPVFADTLMSLYDAHIMRLLKTPSHLGHSTTTTQLCQQSFISQDIEYTCAHLRRLLLPVNCTKVALAVQGRALSGLQAEIGKVWHVKAGFERKQDTPADKAAFYQAIKHAFMA